MRVWGMGYEVWGMSYGVWDMKYWALMVWGTNLWNMSLVHLHVFIYIIIIPRRGVFSEYRLHPVTGCSIVDGGEGKQV